MSKVFQNPGIPLVKVGKVLAPHSLKGEVNILIFSEDLEWMDGVTEISLAGPDSSFQIVAVESFRGGGKKIMMKLEGVGDRTAAEKLKGFDIWIPENLFVSKKGESIYLREILNFVLENHGRRVGVIAGFDSNTAQDLLLVNLDGNPTTPALVPLVKDFLVAIDYEARVVRMNLPDGLLGINAL